MPLPARSRATARRPRIACGSWHLRTDDRGRRLRRGDESPDVVVLGWRRWLAAELGRRVGAEAQTCAEIEPDGHATLGLLVERVDRGAPEPDRVRLDGDALDQRRGRVGVLVALRTRGRA